MFADSLLLNFLVFLAGQAAAWWNLHTGRVLLGAVTTVALWLLADWWLLALYVFGAAGASLLTPLWLMQGVAVLAVAVQLVAQWRRRFSATARARTGLFGEALTAYMRDEHAAARATFRRLVRSDPWDAASWLALGDVHLQLGEVRRARWCYRRAQGVDTQKGYADLVRQRQLALSE